MPGLIFESAETGTTLVDVHWFLLVSRNSVTPIPKEFRILLSFQCPGSNLFCCKMFTWMHFAAFDTTAVSALVQVEKAQIGAPQFFTILF